MNNPNKKRKAPISIFRQPRNQAEADQLYAENKDRMDAYNEKYKDETADEFSTRIMGEASVEKKRKHDAEIARYIADTPKYMSNDGNKYAMKQDSRLWDRSRTPPRDTQPDLKPVAIYSKPPNGNPIDELKHKWQQDWFRRNESVNYVIRDKLRGYTWRKQFLERYYKEFKEFRESDEYINATENLYPIWRTNQQKILEANQKGEDDRLNRLLGIKPKTPSCKPKENSGYDYEIVKSKQRPNAYYYHDKSNDNVRWLMPEDNIHVFESSRYPGNFYYTDKSSGKQRWVVNNPVNTGGKRKSYKKKTTNNGKGKKKYKKKGTRKKKM